MKQYLHVAYYTVLACLISGILSPILSSVVFRDAAHWFPFALLVALCLSVIGYLWFRATIIKEEWGWYRKGYEAGRWDQQTADLEEALQEK